MRTDSQMVTISRRALVGAAGATLAGLGLAACTGEPAGTGSVGSASGSAPAASEVVTTMRVGALQGPTGMGLIGLMDGTGAVEELAAANGTELTEDSPVGKNPAGLDALANS